MARELESQLEEPQRYKALSFEDRLALLVDAENVSRRKNTIQRRIHEARLSESQACVEAIEYSGRFYTPIPEIGNHRSDMKETAIPF